MNKGDDRKWSAYLDGELSVSEIEEFEAQLTKEELEHLKNERKLEEGIGTALKSAPACSLNILDCIKEESKPKKFNKGWVAAVVTLAAAACLAFMLLPPAGTTGPKVPQTVAELQKLSKTGDKLDDINTFLSKNKIDLEVTKFMPEHHKKTIVGAGVEMIANEKVVTLYFTCCGRPAKVYVLPKGSAAEQLIANDDKDWKESIQSQARRGNYRLAVSSPHNSESILTYINHT